MKLVPLQTFRASTNRAFVTEGIEPPLFVKVYQGEKKRERCDHEREVLDLWLANRCRVPAPRTVDIMELRGESYLATEFIQAPTLQEQLRSTSLDEAAKYHLLKQALEKNRARHRKAKAQSEARLLHHDLNTSNILCAAEALYFIDFEHPLRALDLEEMIAVEIAKFLRWAARDLGRSSMGRVADMAATIYADEPHLLERIVARVCGRPFDFFHRWRDRRRIRNRPEEVTKYDIADALKSRLADAKR